MKSVHKVFDHLFGLFCGNSYETGQNQPEQYRYFDKFRIYVLSYICYVVLFFSTHIHSYLFSFLSVKSTRFVCYLSICIDPLVIIINRYIFSQITIIHTEDNTNQVLIRSQVWRSYSLIGKTNPDRLHAIPRLIDANEAILSV